MKYLNKVDKIIDCIIEEYESKHETMTKIINYEYYHGQLYALYELAQENETPLDFAIIYEYRKADRDAIAEKFNNEYITPVYKLVRAAK